MIFLTGLNTLQIALFICAINFISGLSLIMLEHPNHLSLRAPKGRSNPTPVSLRASVASEAISLKRLLRQSLRSFLAMTQINRLLAMTRAIASLLIILTIGVSSFRTCLLNFTPTWRRWAWQPARGQLLIHRGSLCHEWSPSRVRGLIERAGRAF